MNGTETHTLELKQGDTLKILFETVDVYGVKIISPDGTALYQEDGTVKEFTVAEQWKRQTPPFPLLRQCRNIIIRMP